MTTTPATTTTADSGVVSGSNEGGLSTGQALAIGAAGMGVVLLGSYALYKACKAVKAYLDKVRLNYPS